MAHQQNNNNESVYDWMRSNRIYEEYLFKYVIILVFIGAIGFFTFGFEPQGQSLQYSLLANFIYFIVLAIAMALTPLWYKLLFNRGSQRKKRIDIIKLYLDNIEDIQQRQAIQQHLANNGELPPRKAQRWALIFLGWCCLFELFFVTSWVRETTLIWQPDWAMSVIDWVKANINTPPLNIDRKLFMLNANGAGEGSEMIRTFWDSEEDFLSSEFAKVCLLFHAWRALIFFPVLIALMTCLWQVIGWTGLNNLNAKKETGIRGFLYLSVITFFMTLLTWACFMALFQSVNYNIFMVVNKMGWLIQFWVNAGFLFIIFTIRLYVSWWV